MVVLMAALIVVVLIVVVLIVVVLIVVAVGGGEATDGPQIERPFSTIVVRTIYFVSRIDTRPHGLTPSRWRETCCQSILLCIGI